jgi:hypothetical protein
MKRDTGLYNTLTVFFIGLTVFVCVCSALLWGKVVQPPALFAPATETLPPTQAIPTDTITPTPSNTLTPTWTPTPTKTHTPTATVTPTNVPPSETYTPSSTFTPTITLTPTNTLTETATATFTATLTPSDTPTLTPTSTKTTKPVIKPSATPTVPTITPTLDFPFTVDSNTPVLTHYAGAANCNFQGIGGLVFGLQKERLNTATGLQVVITSAGGFNQTIPIDTDPVYGWLVQVAGSPDNTTYTVVLLNSDGAELSRKIKVVFTADCDQNLALVNFSQTRPY